jgi:hypothetical protein
MEGYSVGSIFVDSQIPLLGKLATGEGMDKSTLVHTQIQIIIIHFLPSPFSLIPNGLVLY